MVNNIEISNIDIIKSTYEGASIKNGINLKKYLAKDAKWTEAAGFPYAGTYIGYDAIITNVFARISNEWDEYKITIDGYAATNNIVIAYGTYSGKYKLTDKSMHARVAHVWQLRNNEIISFEQIVDSVSVIKAMNVL
jgi:ketosteroid isomerase-like protein